VRRLAIAIDLQNGILRYSHGCPDVLGCECIFS
jgi:hypothetical protein